MEEVAVDGAASLANDGDAEVGTDGGERTVADVPIEVATSTLVVQLMFGVKSASEAVKDARAIVTY